MSFITAQPFYVLHVASATFIYYVYASDLNRYQGASLSNWRAINQFPRFGKMNKS